MGCDDSHGTRLLVSCLLVYYGSEGQRLTRGSRASAAVFVRIAYLRTFLNPDFLCRFTPMVRHKPITSNKHCQKGLHSTSPYGPRSKWGSPLAPQAFQHSDRLPELLDGASVALQHTGQSLVVETVEVQVLYTTHICGLLNQSTWATKFTFDQAHRKTH